MTNKQIRERIRTLQFERAENLTGIATHSAGKTLEQQHASIKHQNRYFDEKIDVLLYRLLTDSIKETYPIGTTVYHPISETAGKVINYNVEGRFVFLIVETAEGNTREFCHSTIIPR